MRIGLSRSPKKLPPRLLYDSLGSILFDAITLVPEYYLTRAESEILETSSGDLVDCLPSPLRLIELGSGSSTKTKFLIEAILKRQGSLRYLPIDVSESALEKSSRELLTAFPGLSITGFVSDYQRALDYLAKEERSPDGTHNLVLFLGSSIGNLNAASALGLLEEVRRALAPGEHFLLGADLKKDQGELLAAYDDTLGITRAFTLNLLVRINRELGGEFDITQFDYKVRYDVSLGRVEAYLVSRKAQKVPIRELSLEVSFEAGESIHTESSHKYDLDQLSTLATRGGFRFQRHWLDSGCRFSENLLEAVPAAP
ncbi:MAG: L-histidine N(alpha)-methyltransferase [Deltaproteobacteria bacterium]|nr:L-histidine N(alpha)-methyltransferase [Deltaproteobacteria bacterium]